MRRAKAAGPRYPANSAILLTLRFMGKPARERMAHCRRARELAAADWAILMCELTLRWGGQCARCGSPHNLTLDHIRPVSLGGKTEIENLQILCKTCNGLKGNSIIDFRGKTQKVQLITGGSQPSRV